METETEAIAYNPDNLMTTVSRRGKPAEWKNDTRRSTGLPGRKRREIRANAFDKVIAERDLAMNHIQVLQKKVAAQEAKDRISIVRSVLTASVSGAFVGALVFLAMGVL